MKLTPTQLEFLMSAKFWLKRCDRQLTYIQQIEKSDRTAERKAELQLSALATYRSCLDHLDELFRTKYVLECIDRSLSTALKESRADRRKSKK